jgi:glycosyltransferase involved in cell wall biosynthesis
MPELASYVLFAYRQEKFVAAAIEAVAKQTYRPLELIICDDGSPDGTKNVIEAALCEFPEDIRVSRVFNHRNLGLAQAINVAVKSASGRVLIFGAGDDISMPERVARTMESFSDPTVAFVYTATVNIDASGTLVEQQSPMTYNATFRLEDLLNGSTEPIVGASCAYLADAFRAFSDLHSEILREDFILPLRSLLLGQGRYLSARLVRYRRHEGNLHNNARPQTSAEMASRNLSFAADRAACCAQLADDLARAKSQGIVINKMAWEYLQRQRSYSDTEQILLKTAGRTARAFIILKAWLIRSLGLASAVKMAALFVLPDVYSTLLKLMIRLKQLKREMRRG